MPKLAAPAPSPPGKGTSGPSGALDSDYSLRSRESDDAPLNTNPEELIGAGIAGCFAMSTANLLETAASPTSRWPRTPWCNWSSADSLTDEDFARIADQAKRTCPVSLALAGTTVRLAETKVVG